MIGGGGFVSKTQVGTFQGILLEPCPNIPGNSNLPQKLYQLIHQVFFLSEKLSSCYIYIHNASGIWTSPLAKTPGFFRTWQTFDNQIIGKNSGKPFPFIINISYTPDIVGYLLKTYWDGMSPFKGLYYLHNLGGGFKYFVFSSPFGEDSHFD